MRRGLWSPVEVRELVDRPRPEVYATVADPRTYPDWLVGAQRIRHVDAGFPAPDTGFDHSVGPSGATTIDDSSEARRAEPPERLDLVVHVGPLDGEVSFRFDEAGPGGTCVTMRERPLGPAAALTPFLRPVLFARNARSLRQLRHRLEGHRGTPPLGTLR